MPGFGLTGCQMPEWIKKNAQIHQQYLREEQQKKLEKQKQQQEYAKKMKEKYGDPKEIYDRDFKNLCDIYGGALIRAGGNIITHEYIQNQ